VRGEWKSPDTCTVTTGPKPEHRMGHTAVYDSIVQCIYLYGGSKNLKWFNDVHRLDLEDWKWQIVKVFLSSCISLIAEVTITRNNNNRWICNFVSLDLVKS